MRIEFFGDEIEAHLRGRSAARQGRRPRGTAWRSSRSSHYVTPRGPAQRAIERIRDELRRAPARAASEQSKLLEAQRLEQRTLFDLEMLEQMGYCTGIENYSRHLSGARAGRAAAHAARLLPRRLPADHRREPRDRAPGAGHVPRRPHPQGDPGGARLPAALGPGQPAAAVRGVRGAHRPGDLRLGHPGRLRAGADRRAWWWSRSSGPPACSIPRSRCARSADQVDDLLEEIRDARGARTSACWSPP